MKTRIYAVNVIAGNGDGQPFEKTHLVDAGNRAQAERHVARKYVSGEIADGKTIARLMGSGVTVEQASPDDVPPTQGTLPGTEPAAAQA